MGQLKISFDAFFVFIFYWYHMKTHENTSSEIFTPHCNKIKELYEIADTNLRGVALLLFDVKYRNEL